MAAAFAGLATPFSQEGQMYGLIGKVNAVSGQRDVLAAVLLEGTQAMPGCLSYVVASDPAWNPVSDRQRAGDR